MPSRVRSGTESSAITVDDARKWSKLHAEARRSLRKFASNPSRFKTDEQRKEIEAPSNELTKFVTNLTEPGYYDSHDFDSDEIDGTRYKKTVDKLKAICTENNINYDTRPATFKRLHQPSAISSSARSRSRPSGQNARGLSGNSSSRCGLGRSSESSGHLRRGHRPEHQRSSSRSRGSEERKAITKQGKEHSRQSSYIQSGKYHTEEDNEDELYESDTVFDDDWSQGGYETGDSEYSSDSSEYPDRSSARKRGRY